MSFALTRRLVGAGCAFAFSKRGLSDCSWFSWGTAKAELKPNTIYVWGSPENARGIEDTLLVPTQLSKPAGETVFSSVAVGPSCIAAITTAGELLLWGNSKEQPVVLHQNETNKPSQVACSQNHIFCLSQSGEVLRWEIPKRGEVASSDTHDTWDELKGHKITRIVAGPHHVILVTSTGSAFALGDNTYGQLGIGNKEKSRGVPTRVEFEEGTQISNASCGDKHSVFVDSEGGCWACGSDQWLQLGQGVTWKDVPSRRRAISRVPLQITQLQDKVVVDCAAAADTSVFVSAASDTKDGAKEGKGDGSSSSALHTCGFGQFGQLANGKYIHYSESIVPVKAFQEFTLNNSNSNNNSVSREAISCGSSHCAMVVLDAEASQLFTWGRNQAGQCGSGSRKNLNSPTANCSLPAKKVLSVACNFNQGAAICEPKENQEKPEK